MITRAKSYGNVHRHVFIDDLACSNALCKVSKSQEALLCTVRTSTNTLQLECINTNLTEPVSPIMNSYSHCLTSTRLALWEHLALSKTELVLKSKVQPYNTTMCSKYSNQHIPNTHYELQKLI